jgi:hypothetical protein
VELDTIYNPEDLAPDEVDFLGVLMLGLPPSKAAGSDTFRADHCAAVVRGLREGERTRYLREDGIHVTPGFRADLRDTINRLLEKGLVIFQPSDMPTAPGQFEAGLAIDVVDPDTQPAVTDRYLAQQCMEVLFNIPAVYPFLMERYTASGEVWRRLREELGYAQ